ncbi:thioredoxin domain-containing protein, partial [Endobacter medicaginis]
MHNQLGSEASPYLRQHADNPVHWWPWGRAALDEAARRDCPILLSIGYAACHWCHVMAHESFEDARVAGLMNAGFVNIKVDREERPDIDHLYMTALQAMGQRGGWPLTMFLRPDGTPFWGGTYFPPEPRHGQPSFADILRAIRMAWDDRAALIDDNAGRLRELLTQAAEPGNASWPEAGRRAEA